MRVSEGLKVKAETCVTYDLFCAATLPMSSSEKDNFDSAQLIPPVARPRQMQKRTDFVIQAKPA